MRRTNTSALSNIALEPLLGALRSVRRAIRVPALVLLVLALLGPTVLPSVSAGYVEPGAFRYVKVKENTGGFAADFHPDGSQGLIVGGRDGSYRSDRYIALYNGADHELLLDDTNTRKGPFVDVEWAPNGKVALILGAGSQYHGSIVQCAAPCNSTSQLTELWQPGEHNPYYCNGCGFEGRQVAWHPNSTHAIITGNGLMLWTGQQFHLVDPGVETFYDNVAFHPSGDYAIIQKDLNALTVCETPCVNKTDLQLAPFFFGKYNGSAYIEDITFSKDGSKAYVSGMNHQKGVILEISGVNSTDPTTWTQRYLEPASVDDPNSTKYGEITDLAWHPTEDWALLGSSIERQVMAMEPAATHATGNSTGNTTGNDTTSWSFRTLLDMRQPKMQEVEWHPTGSYAIFPAQGGFFRYDPYGMPTVNITSPSEGGHATGPVTFQGTASPKDDGMNISRLEVRVGQDGAWRTLDPGNWSRSDDGTVTWTTTADPRDAGPGHHGVYVRARDPVIVGAPDVLGFCMEYDGNVQLHVQDTDRENGTVTLRWTDLVERYNFRESQVHHELQVSPDEAFLEDVTTVYEGGGFNATVNQSVDDGPLHYRVRSTTCDARTTPWSSPVTVNLSAPPTPDEGNGSSPDDGSTSNPSDGNGSDPGSAPGEDDSIWNRTSNPNDTSPTNPGENGSEGGSDGDQPQDTQQRSGGEDAGQSPGDGSQGVPGPGVLLAVVALALARRIRGRRRS